MHDYGESPLFLKLSVIADLILLNLLTLICSIPIITGGAAITALYYATDKLRRGDGAIFRGYFHSFRENFKQATILWLILLVLGAGICLCVALYYEMNLPVPLACSVLALVVWGMIVSWVFPLLAKFYSTTFGTLRNAIVFGTSFLPLSLAMALVNLVPVAVFLFVPGLFIKLLCLWLFIWFSFAAYCNTGLLKIPFSAVKPGENEPSAQSQTNPERQN